MKSILILALSFMLMSFQPAHMHAGNTMNNAQLQKEIEGMVKKSSLQNMKEDTQEVTVRFLINAQNEVVIFETTGDSEAACAHVKEVLNYRQVKFKGAKQLVPYEITILFVKKDKI